MKTRFVFLSVLMSLLGAFALAGGEVLEGVLPEKLVNADGEEVDRDVLEGKLVGLYFSAEWCPPCRQFTPHLVEFRNGNQEEFEVVFVSADRTAEAQQKYMEGYEMGWPAVPYDAEERRALGRTYEVRGYPTLIIVNQEGEVISRDGRGEVMRDADAVSKWKAAADG